MPKYLLAITAKLSFCLRVQDVGSSPGCTTYMTLGKLGTFFFFLPQLSWSSPPPWGRHCSFSSSMVLKLSVFPAILLALEEQGPSLIHFCIPNARHSNKCDKKKIIIIIIINLPQKIILKIKREAQHVHRAQGLYVGSSSVLRLSSKWETSYPISANSTL